MRLSLYGGSAPTERRLAWSFGVGLAALLCLAVFFSVQAVRFAGFGRVGDAQSRKSSDVAGCPLRRPCKPRKCRFDSGGVHRTRLNLRKRFLIPFRRGRM